VEKARRQVEAGLVLGLQSNLTRARRLGEFELFWGDANLLAAELGRYMSVTKDDIKRVVTQHLGPTRRTIVETEPTEHAAPKGKEEKPKAAAAPSAAPTPAAAKKPAGKAKKHKKP
jgi:zinc protease